MHYLIQMKQLTSQQHMISFCMSISAPLPMKSSIFCTFLSQIPSSFFSSENRLLISLIQHLTSIHSVKETAWIQLRKRIELNFRPGLLIGESKQPEFETALTLACQPKFNSHSFPFFTSFIIKSKFLNPYAPIHFEYCNVDAWSYIIMLVNKIHPIPPQLPEDFYIHRNIS